MKRVDIFSKKYYTDSHNVDEDIRAISLYDGDWTTGIAAGITMRYMGDSPSNSFEHVASRCRHPKLIKYYTDGHNADEDLATIVDQGGFWIEESREGIIYRCMDCDPFATLGHVASLKNKNSLSRY